MIPSAIFTSSPAIAEIFLACAGCFILLAGVFRGKRFPSCTYTLVQCSLVIAGLLTLSQFNHPALLFHGMFVTDNLAVVLKVSMYIFAFVAFVYTRAYMHRSASKPQVPTDEFYILGLFSVLGMVVVASAHHFILLYLGLELFSLPLYVMIALRKESTLSADQQAMQPIASPTKTTETYPRTSKTKSIEAAIKYFVTGSLASGILLYGLSMLYGATKSLDLAAVAMAIMHIPVEQELILVFGLVFVVVGLAFKLGSVPFHMWVPDVYAGAPTPALLFLSTAPKIAALALLFRLLVTALPSLSGHWQEMLMVIAVFSMALGNLAAIVQSNIKRMLAYSSIAHMGYMLLGVVAALPQGYGAALFYMMTYGAMTLAAFGVLMMMNYSGYEADKIEDLRGLNSRNPWLALMMLFTLFSLAGVPPFVGFMAKVSILEALIDAHLIWLAALALLFAIIGAYYYIRVVKVMYFEKPLEEAPIRYTRDMQVMLSINGCALLALGIVPGFLFTLCQGVF
jgi:NADH-quinone oxidoreductase subunit N